MTDGVVAHVQCPDCDEVIPIGAKLGAVIDGNLEIEPDLADVWAHSFQHQAQGDG